MATFCESVNDDRQFLVRMDRIDCMTVDRYKVGGSIRMMFRNGEYWTITFTTTEGLDSFVAGWKEAIGTVPNK